MSSVPMYVTGLRPTSTHTHPLTSTHIPHPIEAFRLPKRGKWVCGNTKKLVKWIRMIFSCTGFVTLAQYFSNLHMSLLQWSLISYLGPLCRLESVWDHTASHQNWSVYQNFPFQKNECSWILVSRPWNSGPRTSNAAKHLNSHPKSSIVLSSVV